VTNGLEYCVVGMKVVRLIGLLLVSTSQKIVHNVRVEMAEFVVPLRKEIKDRRLGKACGI